MITVKKDGNDKNFIICSTYFPSDSNADPPTLEFVKVVDYCKNNNLPVLSGIDANAHHFAWGSTNINTRGDNLLEFIAAINLLS